MKYIYDYSDLSILVIENLFSNDEIRTILDESNFICKNVGLRSPEESGTAYDDYGNPKRRNSSLFLDELVTGKGRYLSSILKILDDKLYNTNIVNEFIKLNPVNSIIKNTNFHSTLLNYYEENDHYDFHQDSNIFTILHILYEEPKLFSGGEIYFRVNEKNIVLPSKNNFSIIFPATYEHKVSSISMSQHNEEKMMGRFSFVQFLGAQ